MKAIVQRVSQSSVEVEGQSIAKIGRGLLVYVGVGTGDAEQDACCLAKKIRCLRIFRDDQGKMNLDVGVIGGSVLVISNFTLLANLRHGRRPAFTEAADPGIAEELYGRFCEVLREEGLTVRTGRFGSMMSVSSVNDGPVNILLDSREPR